MKTNEILCFIFLSLAKFQEKHENGSIAWLIGIERANCANVFRTTTTMMNWRESAFESFKIKLFQTIQFDRNICVHVQQKEKNNNKHTSKRNADRLHAKVKLNFPIQLWNTRRKKKSANLLASERKLNRFVVVNMRLPYAQIYRKIYIYVYILETICATAIKWRLNLIAVCNWVAFVARTLARLHCSVLM